MFDLAVTGTAEDCCRAWLALADQGVTQINFGPPLGPIRAAPSSYWASGYCRRFSSQP